MRYLENSKSYVGGKRLSTTLKAQPQSQPALNDLRKNLQERRELEAYVRQLITTSDVGPVMESISRVVEQAPATVTGWYTVELAKCAGMSDSAIHMALKWLLVPLQVDIFNFRRSGPADNDDSVRFMIDSTLTANRLKRLRRNLMEIYSCRQMSVEVTVGLPVWNSEISPEFAQAVEAALRGRYDPATGTLDLARLHADKNLENHFCPLHVMTMLKGVLMLARRHLQYAVSGIVLANNYLCSLKAFAGITAEDFSALERLDISANKIKDLGELKYLNQLSIKTVVLTGNEVAKLESDDIRKVLPQLQDIHGCVQSKPKVRVMDNLPESLPLQSGGAGPVALEFAQRFAGCYYASFDDPAQRHQLTELYDPQAAFSVSVPKQLDNVKVYGLYNRNLQSLHSSFARNAKLQVGPMALTQALGRFPRMMTRIPRASVDILMFTARLRILTLTGYFKEKSFQGWVQRHFQRTFVLRRREGQAGWLITNDMLSIISSCVEQEGFIYVPPPRVPIKREELIDISDDVELTVIEHDPEVIEISDDEEESTAGHDASPELVIDPVDQAVHELSLSMPKMALATEEPEKELSPPLVEIPPSVEMPPLEKLPPLVTTTPLLLDYDEDIDEELDYEIDTTLWTDDALVIDEEGLLGDI